MSILETQVAGTFYPADPAALAAQVDAALAAAPPPPPVRPKAVVAPHAGYVYSGPVAGSAYGALGADVGAIRRVVVVAPSHRVAFRGIAFPSVEALRTPLGAVPVDRAALESLRGLPEVGVLDPAFAGEHALEVQLPFLQRRLGDVTLVPLVVGAAAPEAVEQALERVWGGPETLVVISTDLSHFETSDRARTIDGETCRLVETLQAEPLNDGARACGCRGLAGLVRQARRRDLRLTTLDCRNSGDTAGGRDRVVGYGAFAAQYAASARLSEDERAGLHRIARQSIEHGLRRGCCAAVDIASFPSALRALRATFVTVTLDGRLRGCIGSLVPHSPLAQDVVQSAWKAAFSDPRFPPLTPEEATRIKVDISILSTPRRIPFRDEADLIAQIRPDIDGLILDSAGRRGLFLPSVWRSLPDPVQFVRHLKGKAGFPPDYWAEDLTVWRFTAEYF